MAVFEIAYRRLLALESYPGYSNDPRDSGGETLAGISRKWWPDWEGWAIVDQLRVHPGFPRNLADNGELAARVQEFYRGHYWTPAIGSINNQTLAGWLFQMSINAGVKPVVTMLQRSLGIPADGILGPRTLGVLEAANQSNVLKLVREEAVKHYKEIVDKNPSQECFLHGWINRANA